MKATVVVFVNETHIEYFEPNNTHFEFVHMDDWSYDRALNNARRLIDEAGMQIKSVHFEYNEFNDPITCFFAESN